MSSLDFSRQLLEAEARFREVEQALGEPTVASDPAELRRLSKLHSELGRLSAKHHELIAVDARLADAEALAADSDPEIAEMARAELAELTEAREQLGLDIKLLLLPQDPLDERNTILEIRAGTGGEEAALFAYDLFRMYNKYAETRGWKVELLSSNETGLNGFKEVVFSLEGTRVYSRLKFEAGTHRVQRVPATEAQGRIHTSAATVAVLPEAEEVDVAIKTEDLRIDVFRSGGARRSEREHHRQRRARDAHSHGARGELPGREVAAQEQGEGVEGASRAAA